MSRTRHAVAPLLTLAFLVGPIELSAQRRGSGWIGIDTGHFELFSDGSERQAQRLAGDLEAFHLFLSELLEVPGAASPLPTSVYLFDTEESFRRALEIERHTDHATIGVFMQGVDSNVMALTTSSSRDSNDVLYHEYVHYLVRSTMALAPRWLNEGLAEFFSTFERNGDTAIVGRPIPAHQQWLVGNRVISTGNLLTGIGVGIRDTRRGTFYAQSWALVHYLLVSGVETRAQLIAYLERTRRGENASDAFVAAFGMTPQKMDAALWGYVKKGRFGFYRIPSRVEDLTLESRSLSEAETEVRLGRMQLHRRSLGIEAAAAHFERALSLAPEDPQALAGLGVVAEIGGRSEEARELYARAIAARPDDPWPWLLHGKSELQRLPRELRFSVAGPMAERLAAVRSSLGEAIRLEPDHGPAFAALGQSYLLELDRAGSGVGALSRARSLMGNRTDVLQNLALLTAAAGATGRAFALIDQALVQIGSQTSASIARRELAALELMYVERHLSGGEREEARERFDRLLDYFPKGPPELLVDRFARVEHLLAP
jgi:tetratricopeptide (TPR) repeat protein